MSSINVFNEIDKIFTAAAPKHTFSRTALAWCLECDAHGSWCDTLTKCHRCGNELVRVPDAETGERLYIKHRRAYYADIVREIQAARVAEELSKS